MSLLVEETFINQTKGYRFGESDVYETYCDTIGELFREMQREYGRCVSKVYVDTKDGPPKAIGWVFEKQVPYEDARSADDVYIREVWVTVHEKQPTRTIKHHYKEVGR